MIGLPQPWETLRKSTDDDDATYDNDPTVMEYQAIDKENGFQAVSMKEIRGSVGANREAWRIAMQAEVDSLRDNGSYAEVPASELRKVHYKDILPMKLATGVNRDAHSAATKYKVRAVVRGHFQRKSRTCRP